MPYSCLALPLQAWGELHQQERPIPKSSRPHGPQTDDRFQLHQRQPRADKLDERQRRICRADPAYREALRQRVGNPDRFDAFMGCVANYVDFDRPCPACEGVRRRVRDRSCYHCHLRRGRENFDRLKVGIAPIVTRNRASHLDLLERHRAEREGHCITMTFGGIVAVRWPTGRLEVRFPNGTSTPDVGKAMDAKAIWQAAQRTPDLLDALHWAGWY